MIKIRLATISHKLGLFEYYSVWRDLCRSLFYLKQREELERLIRWAKRKRLSKVRSHYIELLLNNGWRIRRYQTHSPKVLFWAEWIHCARKMIFPDPQYYRKGYAGRYQSR